MIDKNGNTVDSFPPFSTLKNEPEESTGGYQINDNGADSPRVIGEVAGGTGKASEGGSSAEANDTTDTPSSGSEGNSAQRKEKEGQTAKDIYCRDNGNDLRGYYQLCS